MLLSEPGLFLSVGLIFKHSLEPKEGEKLGSDTRSFLMWMPQVWIENDLGGDIWLSVLEANSRPEDQGLQ